MAGGSDGFNVGHAALGTGVGEAARFCAGGSLLAGELVIMVAAGGRVLVAGHFCVAAVTFTGNVAVTQRVSFGYAAGCAGLGLRTGSIAEAVTQRGDLVGKFLAAQGTGGDNGAGLGTGGIQYADDFGLVFAGGAAGGLRRFTAGGSALRLGLLGGIGGVCLSGGRVRYRAARRILGSAGAQGKHHSQRQK